MFIQTYEGNVGYIPLDFCGQLESSKEVGSVFKKDFQKDCYPGPTHPGHEDVTDFRFRLDQTREAFPPRKNSESLNDKLSCIHESLINRDDRVNRESKHWSFYTEHGFNTTVFETRQLNSYSSDNELSCLTQSLSCDICNAFLSRLISGVHSLAITDKEKADLKSRKLLKLLQRATQEGLNLISNIRYLTGYGQKCCVGFKENGISSGNDLDHEPVPEFGAQCMQCEILREYFKLSEKYSMTDLYATIRDLHIHALSDSDSDPDSGTHIKSASSKNDSSKTWASKQEEPKSRNAELFLASKSPNEIKRSVSFQLEDRTMIKSEIIRNNSFSGEIHFAKSSEEKTDGTQNRESLHSGYSQKTVDSGIADVHDDLDSSFHFEHRSESVEDKDENCNDRKDTASPVIQSDSSKTPDTFEGSGVYGFQALLHSKSSLSPRISSTKPGAQRTPRNEATVKRQDAFKQKTTPFLGKPSPRESFPAPIVEHKASFQPSVSKMSFSQRTFDKSKTLSEMELSVSGAGPPLVKLDEAVTKTEGDQLKLPVMRSSGEEAGAADKRKILARRFQSMKSPPDLRQSADFTRRDDKDIRKSLHDLSQVKRTSSVKPAPMRAQHSIPIQTPQKDGTTAKTVLVKKFNKQMWRPPVGSPEGSDQRPFSPFGGTLPPSKINKKKVHEVFV